MGVLVLTHPQPAQPFVDAIARQAPDEPLFATEDAARAQADAIDVVLLWRLEPGLVARFPALKFIAASAAGVDRIVGPALPEGLPLTRTVDPVQNLQIAQYVCAMVLRQVRQQSLYDAQQRDRVWRRHPIPAPQATTVGLLGLGESGQAVAAALRTLGFGVCGWSRTPRSLDGVQTFDGPAGLARMLPQCTVLVCLLPLTRQTHHVVDAALLQALPRGAYLINVARGGLVDESALADALRSGHLAGAALDVQAREPLPPDDPLWDLPRLLITPHVASLPTPDVVAAQLLENLRRARRGEPLLRTVDRARGY